MKTTLESRSPVFQTTAWQLQLKEPHFPASVFRANPDQNFFRNQLRTDLNFNLKLILSATHQICNCQSKIISFWQPGNEIGALTCKEVKVAVCAPGGGSTDGGGAWRELRAATGADSKGAGGQKRPPKQILDPSANIRMLQKIGLSHFEHIL